MSTPFDRKTIQHISSSLLECYVYTLADSTWSYALAFLAALSQQSSKKERDRTIHRVNCLDCYVGSFVLMAAHSLATPIERATFSPIPNQELLEFILSRLNITDEQQKVAVRTLHSRERQLYKRLAEAGVSLPPLTPRATRLEDIYNDALFNVDLQEGCL